MSDPNTLRKNIDQQERKIAADRDRLHALERNCPHTWGEALYTPEIREGYRVEGDPEGTMGIDRQLPHYVPRVEKPQWTRTCSTCGKTETTSYTDERVTRTPRF